MPTYSAHVESVKIDAIRDATHEANPIVQAAAVVMIAVEGKGESAMDTLLVKTLRVRNDAWKATPSEANLKELIKAVEALQRFRTETRPSLFQAMADAHKGLTKRLADSGEISWASAMANI
jgi:hypothetical protein